ncbi:hypothetical protein HMPREF9946_03862 [Acetobacteraceae bacterium AT-5844]|nr:hypothetical protein HMPREF9946_03862 [Acetobacteraceae bacterium AT-5844]
MATPRLLFEQTFRLAGDEAWQLFAAVAPQHLQQALVTRICRGVGA